MILIYPPIAKPSEPPAGLARLSGALSLHGVKHSVIDSNLEGQLWLLKNGRPGAPDTWTRRAYRNIDRNLSAIRDLNTYENIDRYSRAVLDINRALQMSAGALENGVTLGIANYQHRGLAPVQSSDLMRAAAMPEDNPFYPYFSGRLSEAVEKEEPSAVGFSVNYLHQALCAFAMAGFIRSRYPQLNIIMGGGLVTSWLSRPGWSSPFGGLIDKLVSGPGEGELLRFLGRETDGNVHVCPDYLGFPSGDYLSPGFILPYSGSSGCWWGKCSFCPERAEGHQYRKVPAQAVSSDIGEIAGDRDPSLIHLLDNSISPALVKRFIDAPPGVPWYGFARITDELGDDDYCTMLRRAGCLMLKLGLESGDQSVLDEMRKGIDLKAASRALKALRRAGIATYVYLLFGTPPEGEKEARRTLEFTRAHSEEIGFLNLAIFNMPAYGPDAPGLRTSNFSEGDLSLYCDFEHPGGWDRKRVRHFLDAEFKRDPSVSEILRRMPPIFTSNHAAFFSSIR